VNGQDLPTGSYSARISSGANVATSALASTVGDEVEFDFDSEPDDVAAGATAIASNFIGGATPAVTGEVLSEGGAVVASGTATCRVRD
jgi:acyl-coenzyme A thioesterase PaaI-like protein